MSSIEELITDIKYWDKSFTKLSSKTNLSNSDKLQLARAYTIDINDIIKQLMNGVYEWSIPRKVELRKSGTNKKRIVYIYSINDRLTLGALYNVFSEYFQDKISKHCYSYKTGCNTGQAIKFIKDYSHYDKQFGVKVDIHAYFNNISADRTLEMINELFVSSSEECIKQNIIRLMLDDRCEYHNDIIHEHKGIIPGTPLASFFANYCLNELDDYFDNKTSAIYARYSDDIIILCDTQEELDKAICVVNGYLNKYSLTINKDKYQYYKPGDDITFLGLKLMSDGSIDMSDHTKQKIKKQIHRWCKKGRKEMELGGRSFMQMATKINRRINNKNFKCYIKHTAAFGWCHYMFRYITTDKSLKEIDAYTKDTIRAMKTGRHNKANFKAVTEREFADMGWVSLVQLYYLYKHDFDYYCEIIYLF